MVILVTGASGQLGQSIQFIASNYADCEFIFASSQDLDITNQDRVNNFFDTNKINFCINAAAYTAVDKAESETEKAEAINVVGPKNLAIACKKNNAKLIHISTDFVFDGASNKPYSETDETNPLNIYGKTKLDGEQAVRDNIDEYFIIRTSWVYSQFGNNFMKTMLRLASERDSLSIVSDQIGSPTNAVDLAKAIMQIVSHTERSRSANTQYGIYNFSNEGIASWYDFAVEIFKINNVVIDVNPIPTEAFPTPAKRPKYSLLDKSKIKNTFGIEIKTWQESLLQTL
ncbi:dTDP-4-dehydrorhamnose reductase [Flavobacterium swingsii]|uniref:dTDP-4-dehydrorhamnose reductase n=1 Tax=Flavobacterium swingsii TaxID=498292 RepID=A0A1I0X8C5_9FLAO|nr:dTDP-4-dehydrorhamnose reductase [Flavobacterium swingsii]SFA97171.1 dTDP-4-dehydrorhamnose reductase [Flavobacterium swingsii]